MTTDVRQAGRAGERMLATALALVLTSLIALFAWRAHPFTTDFPWLWRTGAAILDRGALPAGDPFSWTHRGGPWLLYQWLFEVAIAAVVSVAGLKGLFALYQSAAIGLYVVAPLTAAVPRRVGLMQVLPPAILALVLAPYNLSLRPMIASTALLLAQHVLLHRWRAGRIGWRTALVVTTLLYALWANLHLGVALGLGSLMLFALGDWLERRKLYDFTPADPAIEGVARPPWRYASLIAAAVAGSLLNPYGLGIYEYLWTLSAAEAMNGGIEELRSPNFHQWLPQLWLLFVVWTFGLIVMTGPRRAIAAADLLHLAGTVLATFLAARFAVWSLLILALVLPRVLHHRATLAGAAENQPGLRIAFGRLAAVLAILLPAALWAGPWAPPLDPPCTALKPGMAALGAARRTDDRLLNSPTLGSCLIFERTAPAVFIDTRFDMYGDAFVAETARLLTLAPGWRKDLERRDITLVALERGLPLIEALLADGRHEVVFADQGSAVIRLRR